MKSALRLDDVRYADACLQERGLQGWLQRYCQLSPGRYDGRTQTLQLDGVSVMRETINVAVHERTAPPPDQVVFVQSTSATGRWSFNASSVDSNSISVVRNAEEHSVAFPQASDVLIVAIEESLLNDGEGVKPSASTAPTGDAFRFCATWILSVLAQISTVESAAAAELAIVLPGLIVDRLQYVQSKMRSDGGFAVIGPSDTLEIFRRAEHVCEDESGPVLTVRQLAARVGVPSDVLREAFVHIAGVGPGQWLRSRRLDAARRDLLKAAETGETVTDIATKWGFWHLGRFSATYATQFGEPPSQTARWARIAERS